MRLTKHEALPTEVLASCDLVMKLNSVRFFASVESGHVGLLVMPGISLLQRFAVARKLLIAQAGNVMFVHKIHDVMPWARLTTRRTLGRLSRFGTRMWIAPLLPVIRACIQVFNHLQPGL